ncbi:phage integrase family protein [mine drainage metagenome]|uniref:Phage integrase family protein n=1 Tax=mine drainage metagenome TaxID=410659 RepID=A0A1J5Q5Q9_9ZZZZ
MQDIEQTEDGLILNITGEAGSVKTSVSNRKIPLHPALTQPLTLYMKDVCRCWPDSDRLFPHLAPDPRNGYANRPGQDFSRMWKAAGLESGKSFHSLRHTFISCLAACRVDQDLARSYTGHSTGRDDVHDRVYNHSLPFIQEYRNMLAGLDFSHWPGWTPPAYVYTPGQYDVFFELAKRRGIIQKARMERAERTPRRKKKV